MKNVKDKVFPDYVIFQGGIVGKEAAERSLMKIWMRSDNGCTPQEMTWVGSPGNAWIQKYPYMRPRRMMYDVVYTVWDAFKEICKRRSKRILERRW